MVLMLHGRSSHGFRFRAVAAAAACLCLSVAGGCISWFSPGFVPPDAAFPPPPVVINNPLLVPVVDRDLLWEQIVDVVNDVFVIQREQRVQLVGDILTEGRLETYPRTGSTILEPWNLDSVTPYERLESTLQSIRRRATVRVIPAEGGYLIDVAVCKELEDVARPERGLAITAPEFDSESSVRRDMNPIAGEQPTVGWIPLGRDVALEQAILVQIQGRLGGVVQPRPF